MLSLKDFAEKLRDKAEECERLASDLESLAMQQVPAALQLVSERFSSDNAELNISLRMSCQGKLTARFKAWTGSNYTKDHHSLESLVNEIIARESQPMDAEDVAEVLAGISNKPPF